MHDTVLPASWWAIGAAAPPLQRLLHLRLMAAADRDGLVRLDTQQLAQHLGSDRRAIHSHCAALHAQGMLAIYQTDQGWFGWLPHVSEWQPTRGSIQRDRDPALPAPPRDAVLACLGTLWGREATTKEGRSACPRAWGRTGRSLGSTAPAPDAVLQVWEAWRSRQKRPDACRLGAGARSQIQRALGEASAEHLLVLLDYAHDADEPGPRFWRGQNQQRRTYLGLDNLLLPSKLQARLQHALAWAAQQAGRATDGDGTDLGPMAAYRRRQGPAGTTTSPNPREARLSRQCLQMLQLFVQRGEAGVRTSELASIALKYSARISELRGAGADVVCAERSADGNNLYRLANAESFASRLEQLQAVAAIGEDDDGMD